MESKAYEIKSNANNKIKIGIIPGHFATNHSHVNYYIDMTSIKTSYRMAREVARELAVHYNAGTLVDTIICLEDTDIIGAFLAETLGSNGSGINSHTDINVITPELNANNQMIFRDNTQAMIRGKHILLLISSASTGKTINRAIDCLQYYNGKLQGISAIFSAIDSVNDIEIKSIFKKGDLPEYETAIATECIMCQNGQRVDAIINSHGYSKI